MFVGHYGVSFAARRLYPSVPLWVFFIAVQLLDIAWAPFILLGIEHVRIVPGITASNPLDLYYMPYTHSLVAALLWSLAAYIGWRVWRARGAAAGAAAAVGWAVLSHWILDAVVHRPDLPLYDNTAKVGLGLWNQPMAAFGLESLLLLGGVILYVRTRSERRVATWIFAAAMLAVHTVAFFGAPPETPSMAAVMALGSYVAFAAVAGWLERGHRREVSAAAV
jgi:membrane-bound metal-dependent hydrolase YbcI (DUF457 family)